MKQKIYILCIACLLVCGQVLAVGGKCGDNLKWNLDKNGVLTITGTGAMKDYYFKFNTKTNKGDTGSPWYKSRKSITSIKINEGVTCIGKYAFSKCSNLTSVIIPNSVTSIGRYAFWDCSSLTTITIPSSVTNIGELAFWGCKGLTSVTIPNSVTSIGNEAFLGCKGLTSITIHNGVTNIGKGAFRACESLTSVEIPSSVTSIDGNVFENCINLNSINVTLDNPIYCSLNGVLFDKKRTKLISYPVGKHGFYAIPNSVTSIGDWAFWGCNGLTSVTIPNSVTSIGDWAFSSCDGLTSVTIPNSVTSIGDWAFSSCDGLISVTISNSVTNIGMGAFSGCKSLTSVEIGSSIKSIGTSAFENCKNLKELKYPKGLDLSKAKIPSTTKLIAYVPQKVEQNRAVSPTQFPLLTMVDGSLVFVDESQNNLIEAAEKCSIRFKIKNAGKGAAQNCVARIYLTGNISGIQIKDVSLPKLTVGSTYEVVIPITTNNQTQDGKVTFSIEVYEPNGFGIAPFNLAVATKAYDPPLLQVVDYNIVSNSGKIRKMEPFTLNFNLQNTLYGDAEDVKVKIKLPSNIFLVEGEKELSIPRISSGEVVNIQLALLANNNYSSTDIPVYIDIKEKYGKYAENKQLDITLNQTTNSTINIAAKDEPQTERKEIKLAMIKSEVDRNIPTTNTKNPNTFVLIIANEHYSQVASVPFALNDGNIFREYCIKTLGIGEKHIKYLSDATGNQIKSGVNWLANLTEAFDEPQIIVYYAGHGIPDEANKSAYLLPVDGSGTDVTTGYKLDNLYTTLGKMPASQITVFMDACFSGSKREDGMIASARGVALRVKSGVPQGNMVVFSAAQGDETAYPNREQQHGLFTYYLLKKLQETQGDIALKDLGDYITKQVSQQSLLLNSKKQTPCVTPSVTLGDQWQNWKLK